MTSAPNDKCITIVTILHHPMRPSEKPNIYSKESCIHINQLRISFTTFMRISGETLAMTSYIGVTTKLRKDSSSPP